MNKFLLLGFLLCAQIVWAQKDSRYFELRIYYAHAGQLDALIERFRNHTTRIFERHGMENIGYWVPVNNEQNALYYVLAYPDKAARDKSWAGFSADPEWKAVSSKAPPQFIDSIKSVFLQATDLLPILKPAADKSEKVYELRTYYCHPGRLPNLISRFRNHTLKIFENHGMSNIAYFTTEEANGKQPLLVYWLRHSGMDAATKAWDDFRKDPNWIAARDASEVDGKIVEKVVSVYLKALDFSPIR